MFASNVSRSHFQIRFSEGWVCDVYSGLSSRISSTIFLMNLELASYRS
jgi:hypothetical protein